ncbi:MAG TPA: hypothetical protein VE961_16525 [Pyrinomonadaceae bacterium]|nr:hypothetical protein [Pyrinomonadaceae bacterium]
MIKANQETPEQSGENLAGVARRPHDAPAAIARLGWRYHHLGIPHGTPRRDERHIEALGIHIVGFETSPYGIEWMRFDPACEVPEIIRTVPHLAFEVDNLEEALTGHEVLIAPNSPSAGVRVAFIVHDGAPIELLEFVESAASRSY